MEEQVFLRSSWWANKRMYEQTNKWRSMNSYGPLDEQTNEWMSNLKINTSLYPLPKEEIPFRGKRGFSRGISFKMNDNLHVFFGARAKKLTKSAYFSQTSKIWSKKREIELLNFRMNEILHFEPWKEEDKYFTLLRLEVKFLGGGVITFLWKKEGQE